jgi:hypothetical protein
MKIYTCMLFIRTYIHTYMHAYIMNKQADFHTWYTSSETRTNLQDHVWYACLRLYVQIFGFGCVRVRVHINEFVCVHFRTWPRECLPNKPVGWFSIYIYIYIYICIYMLYMYTRDTCISCISLRICRKYFLAHSSRYVDIGIHVLVHTNACTHVGSHIDGQGM